MDSRNFKSMFPFKKNTSETIEVHQFVSIARYGDAVFDSTLSIRKILRKWGYLSNIYYQGYFPPAGREGIKFDKFPIKSFSKRIIIYHFAIGSLLSRFVQYLSCPKILIYHNMTPFQFLHGVDDNSAMAVLEGKDELRLLKDDITLALGDSEYNRKELQKDYGFTTTGVLPIIIDFNKYKRNSADKKILNKYSDGKINLIFVGKIAPNKCQDDIIKVFFYYQKYLNPDSRLFLVGSTYGMETYQEYLRELTIELDLREKVIFTGHVSLSELISFYSNANLFLCLSEHEGFCVPLLESMYFDIPIIAYNAAAVPETLGKAGILINQKKYKEIAELSDLLIRDSNLRQGIIKGQKERLKDFRSDTIELILKRYIDQILNSGANL